MDTPRLQLGYTNHEQWTYRGHKMWEVCRVYRRDEGISMTFIAVIYRLHRV